MKNKAYLFQNRFIFRLALVGILFLMPAFAGAQTIAPAADQKLYTKQDIKFELLIPNAKPENIQLQTQNLPSGVALRTLRKTQQFGETSGTLVELWYNFEKPGDYDLPRLTILIQNRRRYFYYEPFTISENPANMLPKIVVQFDNGVTITSDDAAPSKALFNASVGQKLNFKVNLQYASQLVQFNWDIPKDSIFTQTKTYDITEIKYREKSYTSDLIPVADFEWTALAKGMNKMPKIRLTATAYNGYRNELLLPDFSVNFVESNNEETSDSRIDSMFNSAFTETINTASAAMNQKITMEDCQKIIELRHQEKTSLLKSYEYKEQRKNLEESLGLPSDYDEFYNGFLILSCLFFVIFLVFLIIFTKSHKSILQVITTVLLICSVTAVIVCSVMKSKNYGISTGAQLYSIPEENKAASGEISAGNRVRIMEKAGSWYFVEMGSINGWTKAENVLE